MMRTAAQLLCAAACGRQVKTVVSDTVTCTILDVSLVRVVQASPVRRTYTVNLADFIWNAVVCRHAVPLRACNLIGTGEKYVYYHALHLLHSYKLQPKLLFHDVACMYASWEQRSAPRLARQPMLPFWLAQIRW